MRYCETDWLMMRFLVKEMPTHSSYILVKEVNTWLIVEGGATNTLGHTVQGHEERFQREVTR
jgi:hypothetical protein